MKNTIFIAVCILTLAIAGYYFSKSEKVSKIISQHKEKSENLEQIIKSNLSSNNHPVPTKSKQHAGQTVKQSFNNNAEKKNIESTKKTISNKNNNIYILLINTDLKKEPSKSSPSLLTLKKYQKVKVLQNSKDKEWMLVKLNKQDNNSTILKGWLPWYSVINFSMFKFQNNAVYTVKKDNVVIRSKPQNNFRALITLKKNEKIKVLDANIHNNFIKVEVDIDSSIIKGWIEIGDIYNPNIEKEFVKKIREKMKNYILEAVPYVKEAYETQVNLLIDSIKNNYFAIILGKVPNEQDLTVNKIVSVNKKKKLVNNYTSSLNKNNKINQKSNVSPYLIFIGPIVDSKESKIIVNKLKKNKIKYFLFRGKDGDYIHLGVFKEKNNLLAIKHRLLKMGIKNSVNIKAK